MGLNFLADKTEIKVSKPLKKEVSQPSQQSKPEEKSEVASVPQEGAKEGENTLHWDAYLNQFINELGSFHLNNTWVLSKPNNDILDISDYNDRLDVVEKPKLACISKPTPPKLKPTPKVSIIFSFKFVNK